MKLNSLVRIAFLLVAMLSTQNLYSQEIDDLLNEIDEGSEEETTYTFATFKTTRLINLQSVENVAKGVLDFRISHRFGQLNDGAYGMYGLDQATMRMAFEYGITKHLMVGLGRSTLEKTFDGFLKWKLMSQSSGKRIMPFTISYMASTAIQSLKWSKPETPLPFTDRMYYCHQLLIARKFNEKLSLQLSPTILHRNLVRTRAEANDVIALGMGGRYMLGGSVSLNVEYIYVAPGQLASEYVNSFSVGVDIETGGHVFQLQFTNSLGMIDRFFIGETTGKWQNGGIHFGFNLSRVFNVNTK